MAISAPELKSRASRIRLKNADLARLSRLDVNTVGRTFKERTGPLYATADALTSAIVQEELALLRHLARLHPHAASHEATAALCPERSDDVLHLNLKGAA